MSVATGKKRWVKILLLCLCVAACLGALYYRFQPVSPDAVELAALYKKMRAAILENRYPDFYALIPKSQQTGDYWQSFSRQPFIKTSAEVDPRHGVSIHGEKATVRVWLDQGGSMLRRRHRNIEFKKTNGAWVYAGSYTETSLAQDIKTLWYRLKNWVSGSP